MSLKEFALDRIKDFFIITTLVNIVMFVLGTIYQRGQLFSYEVLLLPPLYGFFGTLPSWITYSRRELPTKQLFIRKIFKVLALEILMILITFPGEMLCKENLGMILSLAISIMVVYFLVLLISWLLDKKRADQMMKDLEMYQHLAEDNS